MAHRVSDSLASVRLRRRNWRSEPRGSKDWDEHRRRTERGADDQIRRCRELLRPSRHVRLLDPTAAGCFPSGFGFARSSPERPPGGTVPVGVRGGGPGVAAARRWAAAAGVTGTTGPIRRRVTRCWAIVHVLVVIEEDQPGREADDEDHEEQREQQHGTTTRTPKVRATTRPPRAATHDHHDRRPRHINHEASHHPQPHRPTPDHC